jgi:ribosomal protein L30/L7E
MNEGRTTHQDAAIAAGYSPNRARIEASELLRLPKIQNYLTKRANEVNRGMVVSKSNYVRRQQVLSQKLVDQGKIEKALGFETLIGKATGLFSETRIHGSLNDLSREEILEEIKRIKSIQEERIKLID